MQTAPLRLMQFIDVQVKKRRASCWIKARMRQNTNT